MTKHRDLLSQQILAAEGRLTRIIAEELMAYPEDFPRLQVMREEVERELVRLKKAERMIIMHSISVRRAK
jgi:hypothetical protein